MSPFVRSENKLQGHIGNNWLIWPLFLSDVYLHISFHSFSLSPLNASFSHTVRLIVACFLQLATCIGVSLCLCVCFNVCASARLPFSPHFTDSLWCARPKATETLKTIVPLHERKILQTCACPVAVFSLLKYSCALCGPLSPSLPVEGETR